MTQNDGKTEKEVVSGCGARTCVCGQEFVCQWSAGAERCWCQQYPPLMPLPDGPSECYCPQCLEEKISRRQADSPSCI